MCRRELHICVVFILLMDCTSEIVIKQYDIANRSFSYISFVSLYYISDPHRLIIAVYSVMVKCIHFEICILYVLKQRFTNYAFARCSIIMKKVYNKIGLLRTLVFWVEVDVYHYTKYIIFH